MMEPRLSLYTVMSGCPVVAGDTINFASTLFNKFDDACDDALTEAFLDSMMSRIMNWLSAVHRVIS